MVFSKKIFIFVTEKGTKFNNKKISIMRHYVNCESAKNAVAKMVHIWPAARSSKEVYFYGDYETAEKNYELMMGLRTVELGFQQVSLYFKGVNNRWIEMITED